MYVLKSSMLLLCEFLILRQVNVWHSMSDTWGSAVRNAGIGWAPNMYLVLEL
jgi:hypothetical protein